MTVSSRPYPASESFERVHALLVLVLVPNKLFVPPDHVREPGLGASDGAVVPVRLKVADLLVQLQVVGLKRLDFVSKLRDRVELAAQLLLDLYCQ